MWYLDTLLSAEEANWRGWLLKRLETWLLLGVNVDEIFRGEFSCPPSPPVLGGFTPKVLWHYVQACKTPMFGVRGC